MSKGIEKGPKPEEEQKSKLVLPDVAHLMDLEISSLEKEKGAGTADSPRGRARKLGMAGLAMLTFFACAGEARGQSKYIWQDLGRTLGHRGIETIFRGIERQEEMRRREIEDMRRFQQRQYEKQMRQQQRERESHGQFQQRNLADIQGDRRAAINDFRTGKIDRNKLNELLSIYDQEESRIRGGR